MVGGRARAFNRGGKAIRRIVDGLPALSLACLFSRR